MEEGILIMKYIVAVYEIDREYGGPEEGGWWYGSGRFMRLISVCGSEEEAVERCRRMNRALDYKRSCSGRYGIGSVLYSGGHYEAQIWDNFAPDSYPERRPHYE